MLLNFLKDWVQFRRLLKIEKLAENAENEWKTRLTQFNIYNGKETWNCSKVLKKDELNIDSEFSECLPTWDERRREVLTHTYLPAVKRTTVCIPVILKGKINSQKFSFQMKKSKSCCRYPSIIKYVVKKI